MTTTQPVSDMLVTVKSREVQRGILAEYRGDRAAITRHFRAAAHLEGVLTADYEAAGEPRLARRAKIGAASCHWRAGDVAIAKQIFDELREENPAEVDMLVSELERDCPEWS